MMHGWRGDPGPTWLYRYFNSAGRLLYVGITRWPLGRLKEAKQSYFGNAIDSITLRQHKTRRGALIAEKRAIKTEGPLYNLIHATAKRNGKKQQAAA